MAREVKPSPLETAVLWEIARYRFINVELLHRVFVKALDELEAPEADFSRGWWRIGGGRCDLYAATPALSAETG